MSTKSVDMIAYSEVNINLEVNDLKSIVRENQKDIEAKCTYCFGTLFLQPKMQTSQDTLQRTHLLYMTILTKQKRLPMNTLAVVMKNYY